MAGLTHFDAAGAAQMVDVSDKPATARRAVARGWVAMAPETLALRDRGHRRQGRRARRRPPRRHHGRQEDRRADPALPPARPEQGQRRARARRRRGRVEIEATVATTGPTGVEMEALTAVSVAALTVYDMLKAVDRGMVIGEVRLALKEGGKSGRFEAP